VVAGRLASKYVVAENSQDHLTNIRITFAQYKVTVENIFILW
jgi:hypothetical protein